MAVNKKVIGVFMLLVLAGVVWRGPFPLYRLYFYSQGFTYRSARAGQFTISYYDSGEKDLPPMILVHGFLTDNALNWFNIVPRLKGRYRLIIPNLLNATIKLVLNEEYTFETDAQLLLSLYDYLKLEHPLIIFFSASCLLAPYFVGKADITLISPPPMNEDGFAHDFGLLFNRDGQWFAENTFASPPSGWGLFTKLLFLRYHELFFKLYEIFKAQYPVWASLLTMDTKLRVLIPEDDRFFPSTRDDPFFTKGEMMIIPDAGHSATWDNPGDLVRLLEKR